MKRTYKIEGMTCGHCVASVQKALDNVDEIAAAKIQLESPQAELTLNGMVSLDELQEIVAEAGNYKITAV